MKEEGDRMCHLGFYTLAWYCFELRHLKTHKYNKEAGGKTSMRKMCWLPVPWRNIWKRGSLAQPDLGADHVTTAVLPSRLLQLLLTPCLVTSNTLFLFVHTGTSALDIAMCASFTSVWGFLGRDHVSTLVSWTIFHGSIQFSGPDRDNRRAEVGFCLLDSQCWFCFCILYDCSKVHSKFYLSPKYMTEFYET